MSRGSIQLPKQAKIQFSFTDTYERLSRQEDEYDLPDTDDDIFEHDGANITIIFQAESQVQYIDKFMEIMSS